MNGKGDTPRPLSVDITTYHDNWDRIFRRPESGSLGKGGEGAQCHTVTGTVSDGVATT